MTSTNLYNNYKSTVKKCKSDTPAMKATNFPKRYHQDLKQIVSQAATHLHNAVGKVGTALVKQDSTILFSHNALDYADLPTLARFVASCLIDQNDQNIQRHDVKDMKVFAMALDAQHAFLVIGKCPDEKVVTDFLHNLRRVLSGMAQ